MAIESTESAPLPQAGAPDATCPVRLDQDFGNDPYPVYAGLREAGPVQPVTLVDGSSAWIVTRYDDVRACLNDLRLSNRVGQAMKKPQPPPAGAEAPPVAIGTLVLRRDPVSQHMMINQDPPDHTRLRQLVVQSFSAKRVNALQPRMRAIADELLDVFADEEGTDLVQSYAKPLPVVAVAELLGIPREEWATFSGHMDTLTDGRELADAQAALGGLKEIIGREIGRKRTEPAEDLLTGLIEAAEEEGRLDMTELIATAIQVLVAGYFGTHSLIGNAAFWLLRHPDKLAELRADPALVAPAVEELLRFDGPQVPGTLRYATEDVEVGGATIPQGALVVLSISAANRDPRTFACPDEIDFHRSATPHMAYGYGIHYCVGARLASVMVTTAIAALVERFPGLRLAVPADAMRWRLRTPLRSANELQVVLR
jgi:cytochrome P450